MGLPRAAASSVGVSSRGLIDLLDAIDASGIELHSLMVLRRGRVVAEGWWEPYRPDEPHLLYSLSKVFTSLAAGIAVEEGLFGLDDVLAERLADLVPADADPRSRTITVRHALTMSTGHDHDLMIDAMLTGEDWLTTLFRTRPAHGPGTFFCYDQPATYAVARLIQQESGERLLDFLRPRLLVPLGVDETRAFPDPFGHDWGSHGVCATTETVAALGQLLLQRGRWGDRQLVPQAWVELASSNLVPTVVSGMGADDPEGDWAQGYGLQLWQSRHGFRGDGAFGQLCVVLPEQEAVVAVTARTPQMQTELDLLWEHLLPALHAGATPERDAELARRLGALAVAPPDASGEPPSGRFERRTDQADAPDAAAAGLCAVEVSAGDGAELTLTLHLGGESYALPVGFGRWAEGGWPAEVAVPVASAAGWEDARFVVQVRLTGTPHLLLLTLDPADATFTAQWAEPWLAHGRDPADYSVGRTR